MRGKVVSNNRASCTFHRAPAAGDHDNVYYAYNKMRTMSELHCDVTITP